MSAEIEQTYLALRVILSDETTFHHVCHEVFATIDVNGDKSLEKKEVRNWDLWGPFLFTMILSVVLSVATSAEDKTLLFEIVFVIVWLGGGIIAING